MASILSDGTASQKTADIKQALGILITEKGVGKVTNSAENAQALAKLSGMDSSLFYLNDIKQATRSSVELFGNVIDQSQVKQIVQKYFDPNEIKGFEEIVNTAFSDSITEHDNITFDDTISTEIKEDPELVKEYNKRFTEPSLRRPNNPRIYEEQRVAVMEDDFEMDMPMNTSMTHVMRISFSRAFKNPAPKESEGLLYKFKIKIVQPDLNSFTCRWRIIIRW